MMREGAGLTLLPRRPRLLVGRQAEEEERCSVMRGGLASLLSPTTCPLSACPSIIFKLEATQPCSVNLSDLNSIAAFKTRTLD